MQLYILIQYVITACRIFQTKTAVCSAIQLKLEWDIHGFDPYRSSADAPVADEISDDGIVASEALILYCITASTQYAGLAWDGVSRLPVPINSLGSNGVSLPMTFTLWYLAMASAGV